MSQLRRLRIYTKYNLTLTIRPFAGQFVSWEVTAEKGGKAQIASSDHV